MDLKKVTVVPVIFAVSACSGGGSGSGTSGTIDSVNVLERFSDGGGAISAVSTADGVTVRELLISPTTDIDAGDTISNIQISNVQKVGEDTYSDFFTGTATVNGVSIDGRQYTSKTEENLVITSADIPNAALIGTAGLPPVSTPTSGSFTYAGTNVAALRDGTAEETGTFNMTVDFGDGTTGSATLSGSTPNTSISADNMFVDVANGSFATDNATISGNWASDEAMVYGNLHGSGATGVSGIYHDKAGSPNIAGAFIGNKQ